MRLHFWDLDPTVIVAGCTRGTGNQNKVMYPTSSDGLFCRSAGQGMLAIQVVLLQVVWFDQLDAGRSKVLS